MKEKFSDRFSSSVQFVAVLMLVLLVTPAAFWLCSQLASTRMLRMADENALDKVQTLDQMSTQSYYDGSWTLSNFLAGFCHVEPQIEYRKRSPESATINNVTHLFVMDDAFLATADSADIVDRMRAFVTYNNEVYSFSMLFPAGVFPCHGNRPLAYTLHPGDTIPTDMTLHGDVFSSSLWIATRDSMRTVLRETLADDSVSLLTNLCRKIYDKDHHMIGQVWVSARIGSVVDRYNLTGENVLSQVFILDHSLRISTAADSSLINQNVTEVVPRLFKGIESDVWTDSLKTFIGRAEKGHFTTRVHRDKVRTYVFPYPYIDRNLVVLVSENTVYQPIRGFVGTFHIITLLLLFLLFFCMLSAFRVYKKKQDQTRKMENELVLAAGIQHSMLPADVPAMGESPVRLRGYQLPARSVGGDLYDYLFVGDRLVFCIGDVSGKGMPASLLMTVVSNLFRHVAHSESDPAAIVSAINATVMERNDDTMLCTLFVGVLDLCTGQLTYCNAGHNPPIYATGTDGHASYLKVCPNMPVAAFEYWPWKSGTLDLQPGDRLFFYTDGVTEARNSQGGFFGGGRLLQLIQEQSSQPQDKLLQSVRAAIDTFIGTAVQHDDITMLCLDWTMPRKLTLLPFQVTPDNVVPTVEAVLAACGLPDDLRLRLAVEEVVQNVAEYAYPQGGPLDVEVRRCGECLSLAFIDSGRPFNPLTSKHPHLITNLQESTPGGWGIQFVREIMDDLQYSYSEKMNHFKLIYHINENTPNQAE